MHPPHQRKIRIVLRQRIRRQQVRRQTVLALTQLTHIESLHCRQRKIGRQIAAGAFHAVDLKHQRAALQRSGIPFQAHHGF